MRSLWVGLELGPYKFRRLFEREDGVGMAEVECSCGEIVELRRMVFGKSTQPKYCSPQCGRKREAQNAKRRVPPPEGHHMVPVVLLSGTWAKAVLQAKAAKMELPEYLAALIEHGLEDKTK